MEKPGAPGSVLSGNQHCEINTLLIGLGLTPALVQAALGFVIIVLVSLYGREPHVSTTI